MRPRQLYNTRQDSRKGPRQLQGIQPTDGRVRGKGCRQPPQVVTAIAQAAAGSPSFLLTLLAVVALGCARELLLPACLSCQRGLLCQTGYRCFLLCLRLS